MSIDKNLSFPQTLSYLLGQLRFEHRVQFYGNCLKRIISALISRTESDKQVSILSTGHMTVKELRLSQHFKKARD